jgi:hypothetical protein
MKSSADERGWCTAIKYGITIMLTTFAPFLKDFRFPPRIAKRLQEVLDYRAS